MPGTSSAAAAMRKKGQSTAPNWTGRPEWSQDKPTGEWGKKCVERWCLLAPYDTRITEEQWKVYYDERVALDNVNTLRGEDSGPIESEDLAQNTWEILRSSVEDVAAAILGSSLDDEERKKQIAHTLLGSLYFLSLAGVDEGDIEPSPRHLDTETRLYSPFGIGTSMDLHYNYYFRMRYRASENERSSSLDLVVRTIGDCDAQNPLRCVAALDPEEDEPFTTIAGGMIFYRTEDMSQVIPEDAIKIFEEPLFGCKGWLSPMKLADIYLAAGAVMHCSEQDIETQKSLPKKLHYFPGETRGKREIARELKELALLDVPKYIVGGDEDEDEDEEEVICIPQAYLALARRDQGASGASTSAAG